MRNGNGVRSAGSGSRGELVISARSAVQRLVREDCRETGFKDALRRTIIGRLE